MVTGATSTLLETVGPKDEATRRELLQTAHEEALRLNRLVRNLLDMTRLEAGALKLKKEMQPIEEVIGAALNRMEDRLRGRVVTTSVPEDLPLVPIDSALIEQVLINLLENATKYTPAGTPIDVSASLARSSQRGRRNRRRGGRSWPRHRRRVSGTRLRQVLSRAEREGGGVGLGLTICRGIVEAHGGSIWVESGEGGGAAFRFTLPLHAPPPTPS